MDISIATLHPSATLVIHNPEQLASAFFAHDPSSAHPKSFDTWVLAQQSPLNRITTGDVTAINTTMAARSPLGMWAQFTGASNDLPELAAIDPSWDLLTLSDDDWTMAQISGRIEALLGAVMGPWRNASVTTKVLHAKRPCLFPVLDSYVVQVLGGYPEPKAQEATRLITHIREQGRANLDALTAIQQQLADQGWERTLVRILDALLWLSHPGAWGSTAYKRVHQPVTVAVGFTMTPLA